MLKLSVTQSKRARSHQNDKKNPTTQQMWFEAITIKRWKKPVGSESIPLQEYGIVIYQTEHIRYSADTELFKKHQNKSVSSEEVALCKNSKGWQVREKTQAGKIKQQLKNKKIWHRLHSKGNSRELGSMSLPPHKSYLSLLLPIFPSHLCCQETIHRTTDLK